MSPDARSLQGGHPPGGMASLIRELVRPYRGWLIVILLAMLVETAMSLAGPWPLKVILDNAVGSRPTPEWLARLLCPALLGNRVALAVEVRDDHMVKRPHNVVRHDWEHSYPLDLSDEALLANLQDQEGEGAEKKARAVPVQKEPRGFLVQAGPCGVSYAGGRKSFFPGQSVGPGEGGSSGSTGIGHPRVPGASLTRGAKAEQASR